MAKIKMVESSQLLRYKVYPYERFLSGVQPNIAFTDNFLPNTDAQILLLEKTLVESYAALIEQYQLELPEDIEPGCQLYRKGKNYLMLLKLRNPQFLSYFLLDPGNIFLARTPTQLMFKGEVVLIIGLVLYLLSDSASKFN